MPGIRLILRTPVLLLVIILLYACSSGEDPVTGTWKLPGEDISVEFREDGSVHLMLSSTTVSGTYRRDPDNNLLVDMGNGEQPVLLSDDARQLKLSDQQSDRDVFLRIETAEKVDSAQQQFMEGFRSKSCDSSIVSYSRAIELLQGIPSEASHLARAYNNRGICREKNSESELAMQDYNKAIELDPRLEIAYGNRAWLYDKMGNRQEAIEDYRKAAELGYTPARQWLRDQGLESDH
ncbi:tetratricopeptide repeat protein [Prosthecochloris sp. N3]|uniref:Tetratricopeptide repeat protein n=1 Tax=Prosthecochloris ethylica TaxID=2743976 RepID=A0ABR9XTV6_9CHLB|nr:MULTISPECIES: tetratricopeptide repeat protein [Prosthecochloris]MEC9486008.1 tetratricopeptide repeat protein [Prosthecochloris sp.]MBF0587225.1 tetratricopeptide repeat protein [Prosthecochloris ethylica]MBF0637298.1 tetratricopeptide repeat protein [Prosthecochloris ethylica]NUK48387.1 tetratricopeptide repeat protein [Prosthecochloris ethylica]RNA65607.1 tetratricopeptide repeat protein [Prosthecochloris sp. ZM_2]